MNSMVLDCSLTLAWCFADEATASNDKILDSVRKQGALVPSLWLLEFGNALLTAVKMKRLTQDGALAFMEMFARLPIRLVQLTAKECFTDVYKLANENKLTTYDASYLYLAIREGTRLATLDKDLLKAASKCRIQCL